jgi:hypothetical protein
MADSSVIYRGTRFMLYDGRNNELTCVAMRDFTESDLEFLGATAHTDVFGIISALALHGIAKLSSLQEVWLGGEKPIICD